MTIATSICVGFCGVIILIGAIKGIVSDMDSVAAAIVYLTAFIAGVVTLLHSLGVL